VKNKQLELKITGKEPVITDIHTEIAAVLQCESIADDNHTIAAIANGTYKNLWYKLETNTTIVPLTIHDHAGFLISRRTICFLCAQAAHELWPARQLRLGHGIGDGLFFSAHDSPMTEHDCELLGERLQSIIEAGTILKPVLISWSDAVAKLESMGRKDTVLLLQQHNPALVPVYCSGEWFDLDYGPLCARSNQVPAWHIQAFSNGFILSLKQSHAQENLNSSRRSPMLFSVYQEYRHWGDVLEVSNLGQLNELAKHKDFKDFIWVAETLHQKKIGDIAEKIASNAHCTKMVLIAGPSSSGKTTFSKRLSIELKVMGFKPLTLSLDDYFVPRLETPVDEHGEYDFEHLQALDIAFLNDQLVDLLKGRTIELPYFDFKSGVRKPSGKKITMPDDGIIVMEGIHGLNDALTPLVPASQKIKIYVSALTQLNIDNLNRIPTTDNRLLRRMVRDFRYRAHDASATLKRWPSVRRGENRNIFPYQDSADMVFNSALDFEIGVLKSYVEPLLRGVAPNDDQYPEARRLLSFLEPFLPIPSDYVPEQSILREFIGGSAFKY